MDKNMGKAARKQLINKLRQGYLKAPKAQKSETIHSLMLATGYSRKAAIRVLNQSLESLDKPQKKRRKPSIYDCIMPEIRQIWHASNHICGVRLKAAIPIYLSQMCETGEMNPDTQKIHLLLSISDSTLDRLLVSDRKRLGLRGLSTTRPGSLLVNHVPVKTFSEWADTEPGFFAVDWVALCGDSITGEYVSVLSMTDIATSWVAYAAFIGRSERFLTTAVNEMRSSLPFPVKGLHIDNDFTFLTRHVIRFCQENQISLSRSRTYKPNDNCFVEQKNWDVVRKFLGYCRFDTQPQLDLILQILPLISLYQNLFQPSLKLLKKSRYGSKVHKSYLPPRTPVQQLSLHPTTSEETTLMLQQLYTGLSPSQLLKSIKALISKLFDTLG
jgi:hypothetical protein